MPAILYCYSNMGRHYIHELYLTPSDSEGLNLMNIMLVVYGYSSSRICGGSRGSDHCACLTRSDVTGSHVTFSPYYFPVPFFSYFFPLLFFPYFFPPYLFPINFFRIYFFPVFFSLLFSPYFFFFVLFSHIFFFLYFFP